MARTVIHLLDSDQGRPLKSWNFEDRDTITLGRADDNDVVVADPYVSRSHAYLRREDGVWKLTSISRQQVHYLGQLWTEVVLKEGAVFRLGANGCFLRFGESSQKSPASSQTISYDATLMPVFQLDREKLDQEVTQIAGGNYFQQLKSAAQQLRNECTASEAPTEHGN